LIWREAGIRQPGNLIAEIFFVRLLFEFALHDPTALKRPLAALQRWPGLSGQGSAFDKWNRCRLVFADVGSERREGVARPE
jgi:hypothetical protein